MALPINALSFCATSYYKQLFLTKFLYALPVFFGHLTEVKSTCYRKCCTKPVVEASVLYYDLEILADKAHDLFRHSCRKRRLSHLYTVKLRPSGAMWLRTRGHDYELPSVKYDFNKRNIIVCFLFYYVWFLSCFIVAVQCLCLNVIL